jgi:hypothetical protein
MKEYKTKNTGIAHHVLPELPVAAATRYKQWSGFGVDRIYDNNVGAVNGPSGSFTFSVGCVNGSFAVVGSVVEQVSAPADA